MKATKWHFPLINPVQLFPLNHYLEHIDKEMKEFDTARTDHERRMEAVDILHSAETFVRKFFESDEEFEMAKREVINKNRRRGYYRR